MSIVYLRQQFKPLLCDKEPPTFLKKIKKTFPRKKGVARGDLKKELTSNF